MAIFHCYVSSPEGKPSTNGPFSSSQTVGLPVGEAKTVGHFDLSDTIQNKDHQDMSVETRNGFNDQYPLLNDNDKCQLYYDIMI